MQSEILLKNLTNDVSVIQDEIHTQLKGLSSEQLNWKENDDRWSIAECLEHLNIYAAYYLPTIEKRIEMVKKNVANGKIEAKSTWFGNFSIKLIHPDNIKKQKTMKHLNPSRSIIEGGVIERFLNHQAKLQVLLVAAKMVDINNIKIPVEFFKLLKINLGDCFQFLIAHERRHIIQVINVKSKVIAKEQILI